MRGSFWARRRSELTSGSSVDTTARSAPSLRMCRVSARVSMPPTASTPWAVSQSSQLELEARLKA